MIQRTKKIKYLEFKCKVSYQCRNFILIRFILFFFNTLQNVRVFICIIFFLFCCKIDLSFSGVGRKQQFGFFRRTQTFWVLDCLLLNSLKEKKRPPQKKKETNLLFSPHTSFRHCRRKQSVIGIFLTPFLQDSIDFLSRDVLDVSAKSTHPIWDQTPLKCKTIHKQCVAQRFG